MADFDEKRVYEVFGLEEPSAGEQAQDVADPATTDTLEEPSTGEQAQELADPAEGNAQENAAAQAEPTSGTDAPEEPADSGDNDSGNGTEPLTPEQRRENAARRRRQEQEQQQAAITQAVAAATKQAEDAHKAQMEAFFGRANLKNTFTGETIKTIEEFDKWNTEFQASKIQRELQAGKLTKEGLDAAISSHPAVQQAQQIVDREAEAKKERDLEAARRRIDEEIKQIHEIDASINSLEDLFKAPYGKELYAMTQRGYSVKDAHYLLTKDTLEKAKLEAARQAGINSARSKEHLNATGGARGSGNTSVPKAEMEMYRLFNPTATAAQIQEHYNKTTKK